jgi:hypothetical protein
LLDDLDSTPASDHCSLPPQSSVDPLQNENQALITIEYNKIDPKLSDEFEQSVHELGRILRSEGMAYWELFQDPADIGHYVEIRIADTWTDHIRQHEYVTKNVQVMEDPSQANSRLCDLRFLLRSLLQSMNPASLLAKSAHSPAGGLSSAFVPPSEVR